MKTATLTLLAGFALAAAPTGHGESLKLDPSGRYAEGELMVKFREGPRSRTAALAHVGLGTKVRRSFHAIGWQRVKLPDGMSVADGLAYYQALKTVAAVEPNHLRHLAASSTLESSAAAATPVPSDPRFNSQWNLRKIAATNAWDITTGSTDIVVAVIGSGVDYQHEDLAANIWRNPGETGLDENGNNKATNGIDDDDNGYVDDVYGIDPANQDADPMDDVGHETACAGIIGAVGNNDKGLVGVNWHVQLMALKAGTAKGLLDSEIIECFEYVILMKNRGVNVRVINNSYGGGANAQPIKDAIDAAGNLDILNIFSAMNAGKNNDSSPDFPSCFDSPSILSVAATDSSDLLWAYSNYGRKSVDLAAPGVSITSTTLRNGYRSDWTGTSFAVPHVTGAAALLLAAKPDLSVADVKSALLGTVDLVRGLTNRVASNGRLNIARALQFLVDPGAPSIVTSVSPAGNRTPLKAPIELTFTRPMDRASVEAGFSLTPTVAGTFEWSNNDRTLTFAPTAPFGVAINYTAKLLGSAMDTTGATLDGNFNRVAQGANWDDFTWGFRTTPANDDFATAEPMSGESGTIAGTNRNATQEPGEPDHAGNRGGASIWCRWMAAGSGSVTFDTVGTRFDTLLAVYTGDRLGALTTLTGNDDDGRLKTSRLTFTPVAGTTYFVAVDGKSFPRYDTTDAPAMGELVLNWYPTPPPSFQSGTAFTPGEGVWGTTVTLSGTNFTGVTSVLFDGVGAPFTNHSDFRITATVPLGAGNGPITLQTPQGNVTSTASFGAQSKVLYTISSAEPTLRLDWPGNGYVLEFTESLAQPVWQPATQPPTSVKGGTRQVVEVPCEGPAKFFRWRRD
jgi:subtilisin family serine protease